MKPIAIAVMALLLAVFAQPADCQYYLGPRGGCYTMTKSGNKRYVDRSMCETKTAAAAVTSESRATVVPSRVAASASGSTSKYHLGSRGGCYTITASGSKRYVDRGMCQ